MRYNFLLIIVLNTLLGSSSFAQGFYAKVDSKKIVEGSYVTVQFVLDNATGKSFIAPKFDDFTILSGPSRSSSFSNVNGRVSKNMSFGYTLRPKKTGTKIIGPAKIKVGNQILQTNPISIEVVKGSEKAITTDKEIFVQAIISDSSAYVGQQIILDYKLYSTLDVRSVNFLTEQEFEGFYTQVLPASRSALQREVFDGVEYYSKSIRKVALFPQQTGTYNIEPVDINLGISTKNSSRSFFFSSQLIPKRVTADGFEIIVNNTPQIDESFSGAVGQYSMVVSTPKRTLTTDEAIIVNMQISGNGDSKTVHAPKWELPENLEMYDPNIIEDEVFPSSSEFSHRKSFEFLIVPNAPGTYKLSPTFSYFNPDSNDFVTITRELPLIKVLKGTITIVEADQVKTVSLSPIYTTTKLRKAKNGLYGSISHFLSLGLLIITGFGLILYNNYLIKSGKKDPENIKRKKAYAMATQRLSKALDFKNEGDSSAFYEEIIYALKKYLSDKYKIQALHLKKSEIIFQISKKDIDSNTIDQLSQIFDRSEIALYAPGSGKDLDDIYEKTIDVISFLER